MANDRIEIVLSLFVATLFAAAIIFCVGILTPHKEYVPEQLQLTPCDIPLMTDNEKAYARATGCATYKVNGVYYVDWSLDQSFYL